MTVVIHSFVAESSLFVVMWVFFSFSFFSIQLMLAGRQTFEVLRWFPLFLFFSFGVSCLLA